MKETRVVLLALCVAFVIPTQAKHTDSYEKLLADAMAQFGPRATRLNEEYKLGRYSWYLDQESRKLTFSENGVLKVIANAQIVGSYSTYSHTWMWAWANKSTDESMKKGAKKVLDYGERHHYKELTAAKWECDEDYAWAMTTAAGYLLKSKGAYRGPIDDGYLYMLITDIRWASDKR